MLRSTGDRTGNIHLWDANGKLLHEIATHYGVVGLLVFSPDGSVLVSEALFPFPDGPTLAAEAGATAIAQPGGSARDDEVIAAADKYGLAMVFTGVRHFRH